ncbi:creC [Candida jiufengensis]|uniref:creC n=1 Tax=Candida jiufengensis TaxID=497108 RepID=UPI0022249B0D|nr:creC [Candida jiufengensis]KAI5950731.1 creC [Candida jiufengensis]
MSQQLNTPASNVSIYLNSVCPGYSELNDNTYYKLQNIPQYIKEISWPISNGKTIKKLHLDHNYLNIARPPMGPFESTTYVSLPRHVVHNFNDIIKSIEKAQEGNMHIGANVNPLTQDPFRNPNLNPGSITTIIDINQRKFQSKNPFNKLSNNLNKLFLKNDENYLNLQDESKILDYNAEGLNASDKLLISSNVNVLNIFGLSETSKFEQTIEKKTENFTKIIEKPLLRIKFDESSIITSLIAFTLHEEPIIVLGFHSGIITIIKPKTLKLRNFTFNSNILEESLEIIGVSSLHVINHNIYDYLIVVGFSNGEVAIINPEGKDLNYEKSISGKDEYVTFFKKFDLSPFATVCDDQVIGHFKISHKPITSIASTMFIEKSNQNSDLQPLIIAFASADGFVKFIDLMFTLNLNDYNNNNSIVTDIVSNYFNSGINDLKFSPDYKFFSIVGKGDLIEVFKMTYYNANGLLKRQQGRSRSGTINSINSFENQEIKYPPIIKSIQIVCRFKGHTNMVKSIQFLKDNDDSSSMYRLISCGNDGKIFVWEFDYKSIPKVKKPPQSSNHHQHHHQHHSKPRESRRSIHEKKNSIPIITHSPSPLPQTRSMHRRNKSEDPIFKNPSLTNLLNTKNINLTTVLQDDENKQRATPNANQIDLVISLYKQLLDIRNKKDPQKKYSQYGTIISPIINDKYVPSIAIPLVTIDLSTLIPDGKIDNFALDKYSFWCFCKNGDIFKYNIFT